MQADPEGKLNAYRADNGKLLWSYDLGVGTLSPPITYLVGSKQYVSILAGWGGSVQAYGALTAKQGWVGRRQPRRLMTFALDGKAELPKRQQQQALQPITDPDFHVDTGKAAHGQSVYRANCVICHGIGAVVGGYAPDLRASPLPLSSDGFARVVREGALQQRGMPRFSEFTDDDLEGIRHYIRQRARDAVAEE